MLTVRKFHSPRLMLPSFTAESAKAFKGCSYKCVLVSVQNTFLSEFLVMLTN